jgi:hypothetical protein
LFFRFPDRLSTLAGIRRMGFDFATWRSAPSVRAAISILATIALILNWSVPSFRALDDPSDRPNQEPGYSSAVQPLLPGNLPRLQPQTVRLESALPKQKHSGWLAGIKQYVLPESLPDRPLGRDSTAAPIVGVVTSWNRPPLAFQARAPPLKA